MNTTREEDRMILAAIAMHAITIHTTDESEFTRKNIVKIATSLADALLEELEKTRGQ